MAREEAMDDDFLYAMFFIGEMIEHQGSTTNINAGIFIDFVHGLAGARFSGQVHDHICSCKTLSQPEGIANIALDKFHLVADALIKR